MGDKSKEIAEFIAAHRERMAEYRRTKDLQPNPPSTSGATIQDGIVTDQGVRPSGAASRTDISDRKFENSRTWIPEYKRARD